MKKKKVVIIGANEYQNPLILKAKDKGYETHVFAYKEGAIGETTADFFYPISIVEKDEILKKCKKIKPAAVCSIGSDLAAITVNYLAEKLGLIGNTIDVSHLASNKYAMRWALKDGGMPVPAFICVDKKSDLGKVSIKAPYIVKPTDRSGSRGVTLVENSKDIHYAVRNAFNHSFEKKAMIEEYIDGEEYSVECISFKGFHNFLALTKKTTTGAPNFVETGHIEPAAVSVRLLMNIITVVYKALDVLGIENSASHTEVKVDEYGNIKIIEIAGRMGGDFIGSHLVPLSTGFDYTAMVLDVALGVSPSFKKIMKPSPTAVQFILSKDDYRIYQNLMIHHRKNILESNVPKEFVEHTIKESANRKGYYIYHPIIEEDNRWL